MRAVADNIAFSAQYSVLKCNSIQRSPSRKQVTNIRFVHHRPPGRGSSLTVFCRRLPVCENGPDGSFLSLFSRRESLIQDGHNGKPKITRWFRQLMKQ